MALGQGRYTYRYDGVLRVVSHHIAAFINNHAKVESVSETVNHFVASGAKVRRQRKPSKLSGLLFWAKDWILLSDLRPRLVFPPHIVSTLERPDIVVYSNITKCVIMIELTSPCEENFDERHQFKLDWYNDLLGECRNRGWSVHLFCS